MKKKIVIIAALIVFAAVLIWYFMPMPISKLISGDQRILLVYTHLWVQNGQAMSDTEDFNDVTQAQMDEIVNILNEYSYRRNLNTPFSDGAMHNMGEHLLHIYVYEGNEAVNMITIASGGECSVNNKNHIIKNADKLIDDCLSILGQ